MYRKIIVILLIVNFYLLAYNYYKNRLMDREMERMETSLRDMVLGSPMMTDFASDDDSQRAGFRIINKIFNKVKICVIPDDLVILMPGIEEQIKFDENHVGQNEIEALSSFYQTFCIPGCFNGRSSEKVAIRRIYEDDSDKVLIKLYGYPSIKGLFVSDGEIDYHDVGSEGIPLKECVVFGDSIMITRANMEEIRCPIEKEKWCYGQR